MKNQVKGNYLRRHRKRSGLSQREVGEILGYKSQWQVSRHERSETMPPLFTALAYQIIFQVPVAAIFVGMHGAVVKAIEQNLDALERDLATSRKGRFPKTVEQKLKWLKNRNK